MDIQKLTKEQAVIISGFTGILCGEFSDFHADVEKRLGRGVQTFEFWLEEFATEVKKLYEADFIEMGTVDKEQAKAQAVQETQQALNDRLLVKSIREHVESHIAEISVNDLFDKGWLAAMKCIQNNIDMVDAAGIAISEAEKIFQTERDKALREQGFTHE